jgi:hypothetical protein
MQLKSVDKVKLFTEYSVLAMKETMIGPLETDIPVPRGRTELGRRIENMKIGTSFVTSIDKSTVHSHARHYGVRIAYRTLRPGDPGYDADKEQIRVWRTK